MRLENYELRSCGEHLMLECEHVTGEIVEWSEASGEKAHCWTIAYWIENKEGFDLKFVGDRPFKCYPNLFFKLAKMGQTLLDEYWEWKSN